MTGTRSPSGQVMLNADRIVAAALLLARRDGMSALSMRRLGRELGVEAMSLYHYIPNKAALLQLMAQHPFISPPATDPARPWQDQITDQLIHLYLLGTQNPAVLPALIAESAQPSSPGGSSATSGLTSTVHTLLTEAAMPAAHHRSAYHSLINLLIGFITVHADRALARPLPGPRSAANHPNRPGRPDRTTAPTTTVSDPVIDLQFGVQLIITALPSPVPKPRAATG